MKRAPFKVGQKVSAPYSGSRRKRAEIIDLRGRHVLVQWEDGHSQQIFHQRKLWALP